MVYCTSQTVRSIVRVGKSGCARLNLVLQSRYTSHLPLRPCHAGWATYCSLIGVDPKAAKAKRPLPPISSLNVWPMISGQNLTSPRGELFVTADLLIQGDWKLITGKASSASWAGPTYPNTSSAHNLSTITQQIAHRDQTGCEADRILIAAKGILRMNRVQLDRVSTTSGTQHL